MSAGVILDQAGDLVGTASRGTDAIGGSIYELATTPAGYSGALTTLAALGSSPAGAIGSGPTQGVVLDQAGDLFGVTASGGETGGGTIFEIAKTATSHANAPVTLGSLEGSSISNLIIDSSGNLFGTAAGSGALFDGSVFEIAKTTTGYAASPKVLVDFSAGTIGSAPSGGLVLDSAGNLFGMTVFGGVGGFEGTEGEGVLYEIGKTASGYAASPTVLAAFSGAVGGYPNGSVSIDAAGDLFGLTSIGGANSLGTLFELAKTATGYAASPVPLVALSSSFAPSGRLVLDSAGNLFGTVPGGSNSDGYVFEVTRMASGYTASPTIVAAFDGDDGNGPVGGVIIDAAGNLFGVTSQGGAFGKGGVFEIVKTAAGYSNTPKIVLNFDGSLGSDLTGALVADAHGTLYATEAQGGANGGGSVIQITGSGYQVPVLQVAAALSAGQSGQLASAVSITDSAANVTGNLAGLESLISAGTSAAITFTDAAAPSIVLSGTQLAGAADVFSAIDSSYSLTVTGATTAADLTTIPVADLSGSVSVADAAANVAANLATLESDAVAGKLGSITLTDSGIPTLSISVSQLAADAAVITGISSKFTVLETAPSTSATITGAANALGNTVVFSGSSSQYKLAGTGDGAHFTVSGNGATDTLGNIQALQFSDLTLIVAQTPGTATVTTGNVAELYGAALGRLPDVPGLAYYQQQLAADPSLSLFTLAQYFLSSPEYTAAHNYAQSAAGDAQFITDSYENLLHRTPEAGAIPYYQTVIDGYTKGLTPGTASYAQAELQGHSVVLTYFSQSPEFLGDVQVTAKEPASSQHWLLLI